MAPSRTRASGRPRSLRLTRRGWWFIVVAAAALFVGYFDGRAVFLFVGFLLLAVPLFSLVFVWLRRPRVEVARVFSPAVIPAGTGTKVGITVRNLASGRSVPAEWWDSLPWWPYATSVGELPTLGPRGQRYGTVDQAQVTYDLAPPFRGVFEVGPLTVTIADGFGVARSTLVVGGTQPLIVTPDVIPLASAALTIPVGDGEATLVQRRKSGDDDDVMTREYRSGDAMRRVHWRASARHGDLMVRQEENRSLPEARIIVDTQRFGYRDVSSESNDLDVESMAFEWVVEMLASSAVHLRRNGFRVTVEETGLAQLGDMGDSRQRTWGDEEFLTLLATLTLTVESRSHGPSSGTRSGPLIALFSTPTPETVEWMLAQRRPGDFAVAFVAHDLSSLDRIDRTFGVMPSASTIAHRFVDEGWLVVPVRPDDDPAAAWEAIVVETGRGHGSA